MRHLPVQARLAVPSELSRGNSGLTIPKDSEFCDSSADVKTTDIWDSWAGMVAIPAGYDDTDSGRFADLSPSENSKYWFEMALFQVVAAATK